MGFWFKSLLWWSWWKYNIKDNFAASVGFGIATISGFGDGLNVLFGGKYYLQNYIIRDRFSLQASYSYKARCSML